MSLLPDIELPAQEFHISSLIVHAQPAEICTVRDEICRLDGAEIHAITSAGQIVVSLETQDEASMHASVFEIGRLVGVLSVALVFHQAERADRRKGNRREASPWRLPVAQ